VSTTQRFGVFGVALLLFGILATANAGGYRFGVSDQSYYGVAVLARANPALYPHDAPLLNAQSRFMLSDDLLGWILRTTGLQLSTLYLALYVLTIAALFAAAVLFGRRLGLSWWAIAGLLLLLTLRHRITKTGANTLEGYAHVRMLAFALGVGAMAALVRARLTWSIIWLAASAILHTTTALWFGLAVAIGVVTTRPAWRRAAMFAAVPVGAIALWAVFWGPLAGHLVVMDGPWLGVLRTRDYLFPASWPWQAWVLNLAYPVLIFVIFRARRARGVAAEGEAAIVAGMLGLLGVFLVSLPFSAAHVALAVQLQVNRVFWLMDFVTTVYLAWWLLDSLGARRAGVRVAVLSLVAALSIGRGMYVLTVEADRRLVQVSLSPSPWLDAMTWLKQQPERWHVLAEPFHPWKYGVSVRLAGEKDVLLDETKDPALATYDRAIAMRVGERSEALASFDRLTTADVRALASRYNLDVLVVDSTRVFELPTLYRNDAITVYDLR
jgi:hypothetical protein